MGRNRYTAPTDVESILEEFSRGWPNRLSHPLHKQHQLVKTLRPVYNCDSCHTLGKDWSFFCNTCDFDLHPDCALEAQLVEMAKPWPRTVDHMLHRDHALVKTRLNSFWCDSCGERGNWWSFYCERCDFSLHLQCALQPRGTMTVEVAEPTAAIEIVKTTKESYWCSKCAEEGKGLCYRSEDCDVDLHPKCTVMGSGGWPKSTVLFELHEHELIKHKSNLYWCDKCWIEGRGWCFGCNKCNFGIHPKCAMESPVRKVEAGWVEQMMQDKRKEDVLQKMQQTQQHGQSGASSGSAQEQVAATQRTQLESTMSQLERIRLYNKEVLRMRGAAGALEVLSPNVRFSYY